MKAMEKLHALGQEVKERGEPSTMPLLTRFLDQLIHDLNNPLGTFGLELFALRAMLDKQAAALSTNDLSEVTRQAEALSAVCNNLAEANQAATKLLELVDTLSAEWSGQQLSTATQGRR